MTHSDDEVLVRAAAIVQNRWDEKLAELRRLYRTYGQAQHRYAHDLGKPKQLSMVETLLLCALDRTRYVVTAKSPNNNRWHGDAACAYHVRESVIVMMQYSRLELLWELWRSVSDQPVERVTLTEDHLQGSVYHKHLRELGKELHDGRNL